MQGIVEIIYSNKFFSVIEVSNNSQIKDKILDEGMMLMILQKGKIYFCDGIILQENQYIITKIDSDFNKVKILSNNYKMIIIIIKNNFLEKIKVNKVERIVYTNIDIYFKKIICNLKKNYLLDNPFYILEVVLKFLKIHNFVSEEHIKYFNFLEKNRYQRVFQIIEKNIKMPPKYIEKKIYKDLKMAKRELEEIIYFYKRLTLEKYIFRVKLENIVEIYLNKNILLEEIVKEYNLRNTKRISIYLKRIYKLNIKELKNEQAKLLKNKNT